MDKMTDSRADEAQAQGGGEDRHDVEDVLGQVALLAERINYSAGHDEAVTLSAELRQLVKKALSIRNGLPLLRTAPPSAPVGVVSAARSSADFLEAYFKACNTSQPRDWHEAACLAKQWHCRIEEALAQQPAACETCGGRGEVGGLTLGGYESHPCPECEEQQPAAVDGAAAVLCDHVERVAAYLVGYGGPAGFAAGRLRDVLREYGAAKREGSSE